MLWNAQWAGPSFSRATIGRPPAQSKTGDRWSPVQVCKEFAPHHAAYRAPPPAPARSRSKQDEAHRRKQGDGVVPHVKPLSRRNDGLRRLSGAAPCSRAFEKQARRGAPEPPSRRRSALRQGSRRGATMDCAAYRTRKASAMRRAVSHTVPPSARTVMSAYFS